MPDDASLLAVASSIADGAEVDWHDVESSASGEKHRALIKQLRILSDLAELHRRQLDEGRPSAGAVAQPAAAGVRDADVSGADTALGRWGHLQLVEKLGSGTFGDVFRAWDGRLEREIALKLLRGSDARLASLSERVLHEGRLLARVRHPNVLTVFEAEARDGRVGICMEYIRGQTLEQVLVAHGSFGAREALLVGLDLCRALAAVHAAGLVHRDVKAQNVMREEGGRIVLMDFSSGQEQQRTSSPIATSMAGTPLYLAPEIMRGLEATVRSDIYSLGVLLYHLVTGSYPIRGRTMEDLWKAHKSGQLRRLRDVRPDLPDHFVQAVERAISPDPADRYESAGDMEVTLAHALDLAPLTLTATPRASAEVAVPVEQPAAPRPSRRWMLIAGLAAAVLAGAVAMTLVGRPAAPPAARPAVAVGHVERIAVLPFHDLTGVEAESHLAGAVPLELTARLGQIGALKVLPWSFMKQFQPSASRSLADVARITGADVIVDGSVQVVGTAPSRTARTSPVRVTVQVFHAGTGMLLWSQAFDRELEDFLRLQNDVAQAIAAELRVKLGRREELLLARARTVDAEAMELFLKGRQAVDERTLDALRRGLEYFQLAAERDPTFAEAHAGIADAQSLLSAHYSVIDGAEAYDRAMEATTRALAIDESLADAWAARGFARYVFGWEWEQAEADFRRALELDPSSALANQWYADYLSAVGRHDEAIAMAQNLESRTPFSAPASRLVGWTYYHARRYDQAIARLQATLELAPDFVPAHTLLARAYAMAGRHDEALAAVGAAGSLYADYLGQVHAVAGRRAEAEQALQAATTNGNPPYGIAVVYAVLGEADLAFAWLERAFEAKDQGLAGLKTDPMLDSIRSDSRFQALMQRVRIPS